MHSNLRDCCLDKNAAAVFKQNSHSSETNNDTAANLNNDSIDDSIDDSSSANLDDSNSNHDCRTPPSLFSSFKTISWDGKQTLQVVAILVLIVGIALTEGLSSHAVSKTMQTVSNASYSGFYLLGSTFFSLVQQAWSLAEVTRNAIVHFFTSNSSPFSKWFQSILELFAPIISILHNLALHVWKTGISICMYALDGSYQLVKALIYFVASPFGFFDGYSQEWKRWISTTTSEEERILGLLCALGGLATLIGACMAFFGAFLEHSTKLKPTPVR